MKAANADVGAARADLFPSISLTADGSASSTSLSTLLDPVSMASSMASRLTAPIFDAGRLRAGVEASEARFTELSLSYRQAILAAFTDVHDSLNALAYLAEQANNQAISEAQAREAYRIAEERYRAGAVDFQTLLETQKSLLQAEDATTQLKLARMQAAVALFRSLAGSALSG